MKTNAKLKLVITSEELKEAQKLFQKIEALKERMKELKTEFTVKEVAFFNKYDANAEVEPGSPMFTIKEFSRKVIAWEKEMEKLCGVEVVNSIKENTIPRQYRNLEF